MEDRNIEVEVSGVYGDVKLSGSRREIVHILAGAINTWVERESNPEDREENVQLAQSFFSDKNQDHLTVPMMQWFVDHVLGWSGTTISQK